MTRNDLESFARTYWKKRSHMRFFMHILYDKMACVVNEFSIEGTYDEIVLSWWETDSTLKTVYFVWDDPIVLIVDEDNMTTLNQGNYVESYAKKEKQ